MALPMQWKKSRRPAPAATGSAISQAVERVEDVDYVLAVEGNQVASVVPKVAQGPLVIPLLDGAGYKASIKRAVIYKATVVVPERSVPVDALEAAAVDALLQGAADYTKSSLVLHPSERDVTIDQDSDATGLQTKADLETKSEDAVAADYDAVAIEDFGFAMLRGMGWAEGKGIGKVERKVDTYEPAMRPKGLGLGANKAQIKAILKQALVEDSQGGQEMKVGALCLVSAKPHTGLYGTVTSIDGDTARVVVNLTVSGQMITVSQFSVEVVSKADYDKNSKYLNKAKADEFSRDEKLRLAAKQTSLKDDERSRKKKEKKDKKEKKGKKVKKEKRRSRSRSRSRSRDSSPERSRGSWLHTHLVVERLETGERGTVVDMVTRTRCSIQTNAGRLIPELSMRNLRPVPPTSEDQVVMVVHGTRLGVVAQVREVDGDVVLLQSCEDRDEVFSLQLSACSLYRGDVDSLL